MENEFSKEMLAEEMPEKHKEHWEEARTNLIQRAMVGANRMAESYRDFYVGASILTFNPAGGGEDDYVLDQSANYKPTAEPPIDGVKKCAERAVLLGAEVHGDQEVVGIVVASYQTQKELGNGLESDVLCPCDECQKMFAESSLMKPWTKILLVKLRQDDRKTHPLDTYDRAMKINNPNQADQVVEIQKEMSYGEFIRRVKAGKV